MTEKYRNTPKGRIAPNGYRLCDPLPAGQVLIDTEKKQWVIGKTIGLGGFGEIYLIHEKDSPSNECVMKLDNLNGPLFVEVNFVLRACQKQNINAFMEKKKLSFLGVPRFIALGTHQSPNGGYRFLIMERLGEELQKVLETKKLSIALTCRIACRIIDVLEYIHDQGYIHADIKAQNILRSRKNDLNTNTNNKKKRKNNDASSSIDSDDEDDDHYYLIDYGLVEKYTFQGNHKPYEYDKRKANNGTCEFRSRDAHIGVISRRSDIESLGYNLILWFYGRHPWGSMLKDAEKVHEKKIWAMKNINEFLKESFNDKQIDNDATIDSSKGSKTPKSKAPAKVLIPKKNNTIPLNTTPPKGLNKFFEEINLLAHDARPNYAKYKEILENIAKLNPELSKKSNVSNGSVKKSRLENNKNDSNMSKNDKISTRTPIKKNNSNLKNPNLNNQNQVFNMNGQMSENDDTELEEDQENEEEISSAKSSSKSKTIRPNNSRTSKPKKTVSSNKIKKSKNETPPRISSRSLRNRSNTKKSIGDHSVDHNDVELDEDEVDGSISSVPKGKKPIETINSITPQQKSTRKYSTIPLIISSSIAEDESPLFGPFEIENCIKQTKTTTKQNARSAINNKNLTNGFGKEKSQKNKQNSCRIYIDNKRYRPRQSSTSFDRDDESFDYEKANDNNNHGDLSSQISTSSTSLSSTESIENRNNTGNIIMSNGKSSTSSKKTTATLTTSSSKSSRKKSNDLSVIPKPLKPPLTSTPSSSSSSTSRKKRNGNSNKPAKSSNDVTPTSSSSSRKKRNGNSNKPVKLSSDSTSTSNVPQIETAAMQRIRMKIQQKKKK